jgi:ABC-type polysaccharide/polyol phosphate export permease
MGGYLREVWKCRFFWLSLVRLDLRARYRGSVMGMGWSLLHPLAMTAILTVVFCKLFDQSLDFFAPFVMSGLAFWGLVTTTVSSGSLCFFIGEPYIRQHPAPMAIYPLRTVLASAFHFSLAMGMVLALAWVARGFSNPVALISLIPTVALLLVFGWSLATIFGLWNVSFRDTQHLSEIGLQAMFYLTPILYPLELFAERGRGRLLMFLQFNPLVPLLNLIRKPILYGQFPSANDYGVALLMVSAVFAFAAWRLKQMERKLIFLM